jgi:hypothetical protein
VVTQEALRAFAESKNQRPAFLFDTLLPQKVDYGDGVSDDDTEPNVIARSPGPLVPLSEDDLDAYLRLDTWTLTQALFILSGNRPPGIESSSESTSHFPNAYHLAVNSILSGNLCREIAVAGERHFIESPIRWFSWAESKSLHVAEAVRAKMKRAESVDEKADAPDLHSSGFPGRPPKAKHLIEREFQRRADAGEVCSTLPEEASALLVWLKGKHPSASPPTVKTIKNNIRSLYRGYKPKKRPTPEIKSR